MLTVKPIQSKKEQEELCALCSCEYLEEALCYRADDGDFIGICQLLLKNGYGYIKNLAYAPSKDDWEAMIIMLRAAMNFMYRCGIEHSYLSEDTSETLIKFSGYRRNEDGLLYLNLNKFYNTPCHGERT